MERRKISARPRPVSMHVAQPGFVQAAVALRISCVRRLPIGFDAFITLCMPSLIKQKFSPLEIPFAQRSTKFGGYDLDLKMLRSTVGPNHDRVANFDHASPPGKRYRLDGSKVRPKFDKRIPIILVFVHTYYIDMLTRRFVSAMGRGAPLEPVLEL